ncbi:hypothetical protein E2C01_101678 [Portunus trituberculatus]|uniref:Uncharacterized protein n=1 Tax=Portunus trituberculatus TaxID=210409 RepID=A0A5B7KGB4_PORTR|nr:hypothetical protein [Portunus trituberculatus]
MFLFVGLVPFHTEVAWLPLQTPQTPERLQCCWIYSRLYTGSTAQAECLMSKTLHKPEGFVKTILNCHPNMACKLCDREQFYVLWTSYRQRHVTGNEWEGQCRIMTSLHFSTPLRVMHIS